MPVDRAKLRKPFREGTSPDWLCPHCGAGFLRVDASSLARKATAESIASQDHPGWDADWTELRFVAIAVCDNKDCTEAATITGKGEIQVVSHNYDYAEFYYPKNFSPSPLLIIVPDTCSENVKGELALAFSAAWGDPTSSSAHIRNSIERLLDQLRIRKTERTKSGKKQRLSLHRRIELLAGKNREASELLLAVKWLGNAGVHTSALAQDEVLDALDILETAFHLLMDRNTTRVKKLAKSINKRKGPK